MSPRMGRVLLVHLVLRTGLRSLQCRIQTGNGLLQYKGGGPPRLRLKGGREDAKTVQLHHGGAWPGVAWGHALQQDGQIAPFDVK
ncbi:hypothetical protein CFAM422_005895 [Trichoderma lentiforme]|uniref:Secreted protein n=1 Tax=Trichoderma lentiforme TaxID=1567552 RepID=A0A9P4XGG2_9HYPO|nr:hypothetical protein CFAM422_005895 [Trichoderma lentiforme]